LSRTVTPAALAGIDPIQERISRQLAREHARLRNRPMIDRKPGEPIDGWLRIPKPEDGPVRKDTIMSNRQRQVQEAIDRLVESEAERGLQVADYRLAAPVVGAVAGTV
jgi:hypothetical protein